MSSKALKIPGVNFSAVALATVTYNEGGDVPCTALALDQSTLTFDHVGETKTLTPTKTPSNTTDELSWVLSLILPTLLFPI